MRSLLPAFLLLAIIFVFSCTKIDSTVLGGELIPAVDNINTFDTLIDVETINLLQNDDTTVLPANDLLAVGSIADPLFGRSDATLFFEFKPRDLSANSAGSFAKTFKDSLIRYDSTVLSLRYSAGYGDTSSQVTFQVYLLADKFNDLLRYTIKDAPSLAGAKLLGTKTVSLRSLAIDSVPVYRSSALSYKTIRQLRVPLDAAMFDWRTEVLSDSFTLASDTNFTLKASGFAVKIDFAGRPNPRSMAYFNITDTASRLDFFYQRKNGVPDTTSTSFYFNPNNSGYTDNVTWSRNGAEINQHLSPLQPDPLVYIKTTPGTAARIRIPGLQNLSNRIIHRAELKMYQAPPVNPMDGLVVPPLLYLERFEPGNIAFNKYQSIPLDLSPNTAYGDCFPPAASGIDYPYFGGFPKLDTVLGANAKAIAYTFNISRYVQQIILKKQVNADLRLSSNLFSQYDGCGAGSPPLRVTTNPINYGQVRLVGGNPPTTNQPYKMRLRIIYSRL